MTRRFGILLISLLWMAAWQKSAYGANKPDCSRLFSFLASFAKSTEFKQSKIDDALTFGPEFTFRDIGMSDKTSFSEQPYRDLKHAEIKRVIEAHCARTIDCEITANYDKHGGNFRVTFRDGWYFEVGIDDGVLEAQTKPGTVETFKFYRGRIHHYLFENMKSIGLKPHANAGAGHIHIGALPFRENPVLFRNFFADYANYPELTGTIFYDFLGAAPPIAALKKEQVQGFEQALKEFDAIENPKIKDFIWPIHRDVYTDPHPEIPNHFIHNKESIGGASYYQAIRLARMSWPEDVATFELRAFNPQKSVDEYLLQIELLAARIKYLDQKGGRVTFENPPWIPHPKRQHVVDRFYTYVTETGLPWERFRELLPAKYRKIRPTQEKRFYHW